MNFSVFENDQTFGDVTRGVTGTVQTQIRHMSLQVTMEFIGSMIGAGSWLVNEAALVKTTLEANGWIVRGCRRTSTNLAGVGAYTFQVDVELHGNFSDATIVSTAKSVLSSIANNVRVSIIRSQVSYVNSNIGGGVTGGGAFDEISRLLGNTAGSAAVGAGLGLGISTPILILGGGLILILLLKR